MKPFLTDAAPAPLVSRPITTAAKVRAVLASGEWFTRKQIVEATGLDDESVNTQLQNGVARGRLERETPDLQHRSKVITQRYRWRQG